MAARATPQAALCSECLAWRMSRKHVDGAGAFCSSRLRRLSAVPCQSCSSASAWARFGQPSMPTLQPLASWQKTSCGFQRLCRAAGARSLCPLSAWSDLPCRSPVGSKMPIGRTLEQRVARRRGPDMACRLCGRLPGAAAGRLSWSLSARCRRCVAWRHLSMTRQDNLKTSQAPPKVGIVPLRCRPIGGR